MRSLSTHTSDAVLGYLTAPVHLVELILPIPVRLSSRETLTWTPTAGSPTLWKESGVGVTVDASGARLSLPNADGAWYRPAVSLAASPARVTVIQLYGRGPWASDDGEVLFEGVTDAITRIADSVEITCVVDGVDSSFSPRLPAQTFAPSPRHVNELVRWGGVDLVLSAPS